MGAGLVVIAIAFSIAAAVRPTVRLVAAAGAFLAGSVALLLISFATEDWGNAYVVGTSRPRLPALVRMAGLWGGAEGSLLLFTALLGLAAVITQYLGGNARPLSALTAAYGVVVLAAANPFERLSAPAVGGIGLQPVLENPAMTWHPPILYVGLVGVIVPPLLAIGDAPPAIIRRANGVAVALLTAGLATGASWAHAELGWGGYWAWDPIESAGLVAWLAAAMTLHLRYNPQQRNVRALFLLPALAAVWATTLTRAGLVQSVHSFSDRPGLKAGLLTAAAGWTAVLVWLALNGSEEWKSIGAGRTQPNRGLSALAANPRWWAAGSLLTSAAVVALGTYEPAVEQALGRDTVGIAGVFFARALWPVTIIGAALAIAADRNRTFVKAAAIVGAGGGLALTPLAAGPFGVAVGIAGGAVAGSAIAAGRSHRRGWLAHLGVGIALVGIAGTMAATVNQVIMTRGQPVVLNGQTLQHEGLELVEEPTQIRAVATVIVDGTTVHPEFVTHTLRNIPTAEAATVNGFFTQTQVILSDGTDQTASYRINRTPRLNLVWLGLAILAVGVLQKRRTGHPVVRSEAEPSTVKT